MKSYYTDHLKRPKEVYLFLLLFSLSTISILAQISINGKVTNKENLPIPGVNVLIKGTAEGTVTDFDGLFRLKQQ
jgi:hypothetical protein